MIMADVFATFGTLLAIGIALPGMLLTWRLLLPKVTMRARQRVGQTPWQCLFAGGFILVAYSIPVIILLNLPWGGVQAVGVAAIFLLMAFTSLGAAGLAGLIGRRMQNLGLNSSEVGAVLRGAVAMELAAIFPIIGWFVFIPIAFIISLGATVFALLGWMPGAASRPAATSGTQEVPASA